MFKQKYNMQVKGQQERVYNFDCDISAPLGEIYDALNVMRNNVFNLIKDYENKNAKEEDENENEEKMNAEEK